MFMAQQICIPEPCHEDWDNMLPEANGRRCLQCCKTVVDFTGWEAEAIADYLKNATGSTCGRFTASQVQIPEPPQPEELACYVIRASMPFYRKLAAMIVLFFGLSVSAAHAQKTTGEPALVMPHLVGDTVVTPRPEPPVMGAAPAHLVHVVADTPKQRPVLMGKPATRPHHEVKGRVAPLPKPKPKPKPAAIKPQQHLRGDVQIVDPQPPQQSLQKE